MVSKIVEWALKNPLVVLLLTLALTIYGIYAFQEINVEAYPDPAPAIIEVIAQSPGASAEEVERLMTTPLEVALAGMPGLKYVRSRSLFGLSYVALQFEYGVDYLKARQEVINRMLAVQLPGGIRPEISPRTPTGEIYRYVLTNPRNAAGEPIYSLNDIKALQDWTIQRAFKGVPRLADATGFGGSVKRYEIHPDPDGLRRYGISLTQLQNGIAASNANAGGDILRRGPSFSWCAALPCSARERIP